MGVLSELNPKKVFEYFEHLSSVPQFKLKRKKEEKKECDWPSL